MENIYACKSKVHPKWPTDGFRGLPNEVWWALMKSNISGAEIRATMTVIDRTIGYSRISYPISLSTFEKLTGLRRDSVVNALKQLEDNHMIVVSHAKGGAVNEYMFNMHYDTWQIEHQGTLLDSTDLQTTFPTPSSTENRTSPSSTHVTPTVEANRAGSLRTRTSPRVVPDARRVNKTILNITIKENTRENFETFWRIYPKKLAKGAAEKVFMKLNPDEQIMKAITSAIEKAKKTEQWAEGNGKFIPYPATWLNQKRWEDEYEGGTYGRKDTRPKQEDREADPEHVLTYLRGSGDPGSEGT